MKECSNENRTVFPTNPCRNYITQRKFRNYNNLHTELNIHSLSLILYTFYDIQNSQSRGNF